MPEQANCAFCGNLAVLRESHVLPAFIYRWLRRRSATGHIRHSDNPNRRVQDGIKLPWLCGGCETHFSGYETAFATKVFHPWHGGNYRLPYDDWLLKFCVSVSWRVLKYARGRNPERTYPAERERLLDQAEAKWRAFLNGTVEHPGAFEQHLLIVDVIQSTTVTDLPQNINRYMTGAVTLDIVGSERSLMTFAKLGNFIVFGMVQKGPGTWEGTKVHVKRGLLKPQDVVVPAGLLDLFKEKATHAEKALQSMSPTQVAKVDDHVMQNMDRFLASGQAKAMLADAEMFGEDAVIRKR